MPKPRENKGGIFDEWPTQYDQWFETPIGSLVKAFENALLLDLLAPRPGEVILDAGCGTGVFTREILGAKSTVIGLDISRPMLAVAGGKFAGLPFYPMVGDMMSLPFGDGVFDKTVSVTALEFLENGQGAVEELFRVTAKGGLIVVATLNSLSPWAARRKSSAEKGHSIFREAIFRSPDELGLLGPSGGMVKTAVHFEKNEDPKNAVRIEDEGRRKGLPTGAFMAARWEKH